MKGRTTMKKTFSVLLALVLMFVFALPAFAAGTDDGTVFVAERKGAKFLGTEIVEGCTKYEAASGSGDCFYDMSGDKDMNICDLVALHKNSVDFDQNSIFDGDDAAAFRVVLLGDKE